MEKQNLIDLGLTDGEAKVYLSLLKLGSSTVGPVAKEAHIAYSNIYDVLERLLEKGLISFILKEKTKYFQATSPKKLNEYLEKKEEKLKEEKKSLKKIIPELEKLQNPSSKQEAEVFVGKSGVKTAYERILNEHLKSKEKWLFFMTLKEDRQIADEVYASLYPKIKKIEKSSIGIANKSYKESEFIKKTKFNMKYVNFPIPGNIDIMGDQLLLISWTHTPTAVLITSQDMANKFKDYFYSIWKRK
jgi:HTH-type transcriptional regulator, sugar sensing transcriptional regulator